MKKLTLILVSSLVLIGIVEAKSNDLLSIKNLKETIIKLQSSEVKKITNLNNKNENIEKINDTDRNLIVKNSETENDLTLKK
jgi:hypothetical protein